MMCSESVTLRQASRVLAVRGRLTNKKNKNTKEKEKNTRSRQCSARVCVCVSTYFLASRDFVLLQLRVSVCGTVQTSPCVMSAPDTYVPAGGTEVANFRGSTGGSFFFEKSSCSELQSWVLSSELMSLIFFVFACCF